MEVSVKYREKAWLDLGVGVEGEGSKTPLCVWKDFPRIALRISQDVGHPAGTQRFQMNRSLT